MTEEIRKLINNLANESNFSKKSYLCNKLARLYQLRDYHNMGKYAFHALEFALIANDKSLISESNMNVAAYLVESQKYKKALDHYISALENADSQNIKNLVLINTGLGSIYNTADQFEQAFIYHKKALDLADEANLLDEKISCLNNISNIYNNQNNYTETLKYLNEALILVETINSPLKKAILLLNIAECHLNLNSTDEVEQTLLELESIVEDSNMMWLVGAIQTLWGCYYSQTDILDLATDKFEMGLTILIEEDQYFFVITTYQEYAEMFIKHNKTENAKKVFSDCLKYIEDNEAESIYPKIFEIVANFYTTQKNQTLADMYYEKYNNLIKDINISLDKVKSYLDSK